MRDRRRKEEMFAEDYNPYNQLESLEERGVDNGWSFRIRNPRSTRVHDEGDTYNNWFIPDSKFSSR
jgi:hypothetical protein